MFYQFHLQISSEARITRSRYVSFREEQLYFIGFARKIRTYLWLLNWWERFWFALFWSQPDTDSDPRRSGVNFINMLWPAFMLVYPKSDKNKVKLSVFFALLGSVCIKAVRKTLMKLTPALCGQGREGPDSTSGRSGPGARNPWGPPRSRMWR